ncbi:hypothetical protein ACSBR2_034539 [Camellia fascicularis]
MSDMISENDHSLVESRSGFSISQIEEVKTWLVSQFDGDGKDVPDFEYTSQSISHLHNLATLSQANTQAALSVANDLHQKASEYHSQAARIREILESVGLAKESLPPNVIASTQVLAIVANLLDIRDTELSRTLQRLEDEVSPYEAQIEKLETNLAIMATKEQQYILQHANYKTIQQLEAKNPHPLA